MADRWDYRSVEGALYRLGQPPEAAPTRAAPLSVPRPAGPPGPSAPIREIAARVDLDATIRRSLGPEEISAVKEHYVLGVRRHGYKRRAGIIKRLMQNLNADEP